MRYDPSYPFDFFSPTSSPNRLSSQAPAALHKPHQTPKSCPETLRSFRIRTRARRHQRLHDHRPLRSPLMTERSVYDD